MSEKQRILIRQVKEWPEIMIGFESRNRYEILDGDGEKIGYAAEEGGGFGRAVGRQLLGSARKATIHIYDEEGKEVGRGEKPFRWYFYRCEAFDGDGRKLGAIERKWSLLHRKFVIENAQGEEVFEIFSPMLRVWTFKLLYKGKEVGRISKKWGGMLREVFSDADVFGIEYDMLAGIEELRPVLIIATFLIDFTCFENNQGSRGLLSLGGD